MPYREMTRDQVWLLPPSLDELIPADHPARFVAEFVDTLDREEWAELGVDLDGEALGAPAYHPRALLSVWLYGFMTNVRSCRKLEAACRDQLPCLWLTGWQQPDHNTLWRFYQKHRGSMRALFRRTVKTAVTLELVDLAVQAVDGTKVRANASHTRSYNARQLDELLERTERAIADLEARNEAGDDSAPVRLPEGLADRETLRRRVRQVRQAMDQLDARGRSKKRVNLTGIIYLTQDSGVARMRGCASSRLHGRGFSRRYAPLGTRCTSPILPGGCGAGAATGCCIGRRRRRSLSC